MVLLKIKIFLLLAMPFDVYTLMSFSCSALFFGISRKLNMTWLISVSDTRDIPGNEDQFHVGLR